MESDEIKRHFTVLTEHLDSKITLLAEGQVALGDRLSRRIDNLEQRLKEDSEETRALIRLSYAQLDRRVSSLENDVSELRERLGKLESGLNH